MNSEEVIMIKQDQKNIFKYGSPFRYGSNNKYAGIWDITAKIKSLPKYLAKFRVWI